MEFRPQEGPQEDFLSCGADIAIYGGAAGSGKTFAMLLDPIRHKDTGKAGAVFFRRNSNQITNEGGLWDEAKEMYHHAGGVPKESPFPVIKFPSGFKISFRHLQYDSTVLNWQGGQIAIQYWDELTHFTQKQFIYMLSRNRSTSGVKPYVRGSTNPDKASWVRNFLDWWIGEDGFPDQSRSGKLRWLVNYENKFHWFDTREEAIEAFKEIDPDTMPLSVTFIPAKLSDNRILMEKDPGYRSKLMSLSKVDRERLLGGNWDVMPVAGSYFQQHYFEEVDAHPPLVKVVRAWDRAATEHNPGDPGDPDWTVGLKLGVDKHGFYYVLDIVCVRLSAHKVEQLIRNTATQDGTSVIVKAFQDPGGAGKGEIENFTRVMAGFIVNVEKINVNKEVAAKAVSAQAEAGNIKILSSCREKQRFYNELTDFPQGRHDDVVDAFSSAFNCIALAPMPKYTKEMKEMKERVKMKKKRATKERW